MDVKRKLGVKLMKKLSYHTAEMWDNEKLEKKLNCLLSAGLVEKGHKLDTPEATIFLDKILENQGNIKIIEPDETPEENGYAKVKELKPGAVEAVKPKPKKEKKEKIMTENTETEVKVEKVKKEKKEKTARDAFGAKEGSQAAIINAALEATNTIKSVSEKSGLPTARVALHLKYLVKKGVLQQNGKEYTKVNG